MPDTTAPGGDLSFEAVDWDEARRLVTEYRSATELEEGGDAEIAAATAMADFLDEVEKLAPRSLDDRPELISEEDAAAEEIDRASAAWADNAREIDHLRAELDDHLTAAIVAVRAARHPLQRLTSDRVYDVEIVEGTGIHALGVLDDLLVQLAGVRALTVQAGR